MEKLTGQELQPGHKIKTGAQYQRHVKYDPGMKELTQIVAGLYKDVKRINKCITLQGAQNYIKNKPNWEAKEDDITGPNGKPDGIKEVFVTDGRGKVKVINGYGLEKSKYPLRKAYRTKFPTKESRLGDGKFSKFMDDVKKTEFDEEEENLYYTTPLVDLGEEFAKVQGNIKPKEVFKQHLFKPTYDGIKTSLKKAFPPMVMAQIYNKALAKSYDEIIKNPVISKLTGSENISSFNKNTINKIVKSDAFRVGALDEIRIIIYDDEVKKKKNDTIIDWISTMATQYEHK